MAHKTTNIDSIKFSLRSYKGHLSSTLTVADNLVHLAHADPTPSLTGKLEAELTKLEGLNENITERYRQLQEADPTNFDEYTTGLEECVDRFIGCQTDILRTIADCRRAGIAAQPPLQQPPAAGQHGRIKTNDALKPFRLTKEHTPVEMRQWTLQFKAFYSTSQLETLALPDQQAYLRICMDPLLYERFQAKIGATTQLFSDDPDEDSCIKFLEEEFSLQYPLFTRRLEFFRASQSKSQNFSDFLTKLDAKADEADLANLDTADIYVFRYICACTDQKLKEKLLKLENPTREDIKRTTRAYEVTLKSMKAFDVSSATINQTTSQHKKGQNKQQGKKDNKKQKSNIPSFLKGKCIRCAETGHKPHDCPMIGYSCNFCKKKGHIKAACLQRSRANSRANSRNTSTTTSRAPSPTDQTKSSATTASCAQTRKTVSRPTPRINVDYKVGQKSFTFLSLPDTGTTRTIISHSILQTNQIPVLDAPDELLFAANKQQMKCVGQIVLTACVNQGHRVKINALVSSDLDNDILLSWHDMQALKIIS